jgi:hypothetical protein
MQLLKEVTVGWIRSYGETRNTYRISTEKTIANQLLVTPGI